MFPTDEQVFAYRPTTADDRAALMLAIRAGRKGADEDEAGLSVARAICVDASGEIFPRWTVAFYARKSGTMHWNDTADYTAKTDDEIAAEILGSWDREWDDVQTDAFSSYANAGPQRFAPRASEDLQ